MKHVLATAFLIASASLAHAGSIVVTVTTTAGGAATITTAIPDAQIGRLIAVYGVAQVDTGTKDGQGNPIMRAPTRPEILKRWVADAFQATKYRVQNHERDETAKTVAPLDLGTPGQ